MTALTRRQRAEFRAGRALSSLPPRWQIRLSGRPPVIRDGQRLETDIQLLLALSERRGRLPYEQMTLPEGREELRSSAQVAGGAPPEMVAVCELRVDGAAGPLRARHYIPVESVVPLPLIVFFHGGGFVLGDLDSHDVPCRLLAKHAGAHVLSVDYRLAPEHPFPAAVEDGVAAFAWARDHAASLGADPGCIAVAGDSAGGNLSAVTAWQASRAGAGPAAQILIYPVTDYAARTRSHELFDSGFLLVREDMDWFTAHYVSAADPEDPRLSIARAPGLEAAPPALVVTAGFDPLRDEGEAYAARLHDAGVPVVLRRFPGLIHGFINLTGLSRSSHDAVVEIAGATRALLASARRLESTAAEPAGLAGRGASLEL